MKLCYSTHRSTGRLPWYATLRCQLDLIDIDVDGFHFIQFLIKECGSNLLTQKCGEKSLYFGQNVLHIAINNRFCLEWVERLVKISMDLQVQESLLTAQAKGMSCTHKRPLFRVFHFIPDVQCLKLGAMF